MNFSTFDAARSCQKVPAVTPVLGRASILRMVVLAASVATSACSSSSTAVPGTVSQDAGTGAGGGPATLDAGTGTGGGPATQDAGTGTDSGAARPAAAFFRGTLAATVAASKASSDPFFNGVKAEATAAGDNGHDALLGTTHLGTTLNQFVGLDTWSSDANMDAVYSNPQVQAFGASFYASPPEFKTFYLTDFYQWGSPDSGDASSPHYFVMARGRFNATPDKIKAAHDAFAQGHEAQLKTAGVVAHIVYSGRQDPQDALIVDIWSADTNMDALYSDPQLKSAVSALFDATGPNFGVYGSTDWVTW
jgi:quinol monooxygenase YgiN